MEYDTDPAAAATMKKDTFEENDTGARRVGGPRKNWRKETVQDTWDLIKGQNSRRPATINLKRSEHHALLKNKLEQIYNAWLENKRKPSHVGSIAFANYEDRRDTNDTTQEPKRRRIN